MKALNLNTKSTLQDWLFITIKFVIGSLTLLWVTTKEKEIMLSHFHHITYALIFQILTNKKQ